MGLKDQLERRATRLYEALACPLGRGYYGRGPAHHGAIFIHVPKTAGTSIYRTVGKNWKSHKTAADYRRANPAKFARLFKFAFVRNPWDRLVSTYHYVKKKPHSFPDATAEIADITVDRFVLERLSGCLDSTVLAPQHKFVTIDGVSQLDFTGRFERLEEDFAVIIDQLQIPQAKQLPHRNLTDHDHWKSYYTPESYNLVGDLYAADIEMFG